VFASAYPEGCNLILKALDGETKGLPLRFIQGPVDT
jgi:hypothetical protein